MRLLLRRLRAAASFLFIAGVIWVVVSAFHKPGIKSPYTVDVDYNRSTFDGVRAGHYDDAGEIIELGDEIVDDVVTPTGNVKQQIYIMHFDQDSMENEAVIAALTKTNLRPVTLKELLALGEQHPRLVAVYPIVALGSHYEKKQTSHPFYDLVRDGNPMLTPIGGGIFTKRGVILWGPNWGRGFYFAAVRKD